MAFKTPVLFVIFNRPEETRMVFNKIKKLRPDKLFIDADGPRDGNLDDFWKCKKNKRNCK